MPAWGKCLIPAVPTSGPSVRRGSIQPWGQRMSFPNMAIALAAATIAFSAASGAAKAGDLPVKAAKSPPADLPFFLLADDRITFSYMPKGTDSGNFSVRPDGGKRHHERAGTLYPRIILAGPFPENACTQVISVVL